MRAATLSTKRSGSACARSRRGLRASSPNRAREGARNPDRSLVRRWITPAEIRFGPGYAVHEYVQLQGAEPKLPRDSVYLIEQEKRISAARRGGDVLLVGCEVDAGRRAWEGKDPAAIRQPPHRRRTTVREERSSVGHVGRPSSSAI